MAWASGRRVKKSVKTSAILPATVGGSCIFRRGTCSLSAVEKKYKGTLRPLFQPLQTHKGLRATPRSPQAASPILVKEPRHLPRLARACAQRSQNWLGSDDQYRLSWRLAAYRLLQIPKQETQEEESPPPHHNLTPPPTQGQDMTEPRQSTPPSCPGPFSPSPQLPSPRRPPHLPGNRCGTQEAVLSGAP